jgi:hypothetical protein
MLQPPNPKHDVDVMREGAMFGFCAQNDSSENDKSKHINAHMTHTFL